MLSSKDIERKGEQFKKDIVLQDKIVKYMVRNE